MSPDKAQNQGQSNPPQPWEVSGSQRIIDTPWLSLRADDCVMADGTSVAPYYIVECPDWVHILPFDSQGRMLVVRQYRHGAAKVTWEFPGGECDPGDEGILAAARRELLEETGAEAGRFIHLGSHYANPARQTNRVHTVLAEDARITRPPRYDETEHITCEFWTLEQVLDAVRSGEFPHLLHAGSLLLALQFRKSV